MLIAALGGEGGGVLTNWLIEAADRSGWYCQSTSLAGVAQRTGATIYYLEFMPRTHSEMKPVMSLFPAQGDIDLAATSEIAEAGRMISRGFISPNRTTLISSSHRVYGIDEKSHPGDGTVDSSLLLELADRYSYRFIHFDMAELVERHKTVISASLLGAIAGSNVLPFNRGVFRELVSSGKNADANRNAFDESSKRANPSKVYYFEPEMEPIFQLPAPTSELGKKFLPLLAKMPEEVHEVAYHAIVRLLDYQDVGYASLFLEKAEQILERDDPSAKYELSRETFRALSLWMSYEDIPRVAQLKVRPQREAEIRSEVQASPSQPLRITEYFHPRVEEIAAILPRKLGGALLNSNFMKKALGRLLGPRKLRTDTLFVEFVMRCLANLRFMRASTYGYFVEWKMIDRWFGAIVSAPSLEHATNIAKLGQMVKGYGATRQRTTRRLSMILDFIDSNGFLTPNMIVSLQQAAMADESDGPLVTAMESLQNSQLVTVPDA